MDINNDKLREIIIYQHHRAIASLYKNFLNILEDIRNDRYTIDENTYNNLRKRILDSGNNTSRELEDLLLKLDFTLSNESVSRINNNNN